MEKHEYIVAIKTGKNYYYNLTGRDYLISLDEARDYASHFSSQFKTVILQVIEVCNE
jgi:hypothetical protein